MDIREVTENNATNIVLLQVHRQTHHAVFKFQQLAGHRVVQAVNTADTVTNRDNRTHLSHINVSLIIFNLLLQNRADFFWSDAQNFSPL